MSKGPWNRTLSNPILPALSYCPYSARDFRNTHRHTRTDCNYCTLFRNTCANFSPWSFASVDPLFLHGDLLQQFCKGNLFWGGKTLSCPLFMPSTLKFQHFSISQTHLWIIIHQFVYSAQLKLLLPIVVKEMQKWGKPEQVRFMKIHPAEVWQANLTNCYQYIISNIKISQSKVGGGGQFNY